jgi:hypothetical protein
MVMIRNIIVFALTFCVILTTGYLDISMGATVGCIGQVATFPINSDNIINHTVYTFRNFNDTKTIRIDRIVVRDADGNVRCDYPTLNSFPTDFKSALPPHQSTRLVTSDMAGCIAPQPFGAIQTVITWSFSSGKVGIPLSVTSTMAYMNMTDNETFGWPTVMCQPIVPK